MEQLMCLMEESLQVQGAGTAHSESWDQVVEMRVKVKDCKQRLEVKPYFNICFCY
jgi:hypothetical protein